MYKFLVVLVVYLALTEARPKWQFLPEKPGYVPVYIQNGDTPLEEINPDLAEAFHALPVGRSVGKEVEAAPEIPQDSKIPEDIPSESVIDRRPYENQVAKGSYEVKTQERR
ncbi:uncharacterized protein LOC121730329 [Aricia agestis]|uniref:uncharacterized protein LOC121730329 n=1 Tax=Aricia agestis TaxID=91739 RepID=UPI001C20331D|nr:uncharacterized protein LOC121730329 [Aricia agestis]